MKEKILIVEDNPQNMRLLEMTLRTRGYIIIEATDGEEALDTAIKDKPDLIIMDMQLPKMSGAEVVKRLRQMPGFEKIPIIAVTAYAMKGDKEKIIKAGCDVYVSKPINTRQLPEIIAKTLLKRRRGSTQGKGNG